MSKPLVLVAGATGYLGRHVVKALDAAGYPVRALARDAARLDDVRSSCAEIVVAEATRDETLEALIGDATVVFSSLGKRDTRRRPTVFEVDQDANLNIVQRAERAGVEHFIFISAFHAQTLRARGVDLALARERVVDRIKASPMAATILRPTGFFNDMEEFFRMAARGKVWVVGDGTSRINPIHGADLAQEVVRCIADPAARDRELDRGGPQTLTYNEIAELACAAQGKPTRIGHLPPWVLRGAAPLVKPFNSMLGGLIKTIYHAGCMDFVAPACGTHRLADHYAELARHDG
jgi:uncharacterized protein YbjT (DUF2867 family)